MLAKIDWPSLVVPLSIGIFYLISLFAKRGQKRLKDSLEVRDGRIVLKEGIRLKLSRGNPDRLRGIEAMIEKSFKVDENGQIVAKDGDEETPAERPAPMGPTASTPPPGRGAPPAPPAPASDPDSDRFRSVWEEQDQGPSIWDEKDKADFWGSDTKRGE